MNTIVTPKSSRSESTDNWYRILWTAFFSRIRFVLMASLCCAVIAGISSVLLPKVYTGGFSILVKAPEIDQSAISDGADISLRPGSVDGNLIADEYFILTSNGLASQVAESYGTSTPLPSGYLASALPSWMRPDQTSPASVASTKQDILARELSKDLVVTRELKSDIIKITMKSHDIVYLEKVLNLYSEQYLNYRKSIWFNQEAQNFFTRQADDAFREWQMLSTELIEVRSQLNEVDPQIEHRELEQRTATSIGRLEGVELELAQYAAQLKTLNAMKPEQSITFFNHETKDNRLFWQLKVDIGESKANRQKLLKDHTEKSPLVLKSNRQLNGLYKEYQGIIRSLIVNSVSLLNTERDALIASNRKIGQRRERLFQLIQHIKELEKKSQMAEGQYASYQKKANTIEGQSLSRNALGTAVRVLSPPMVQSAAIWPNRSSMIIIAAVLGFFLSLVIVVLMWMMKDTFHFPEEVASYLGLPVLTTFTLESHRATTTVPLSPAPDAKVPTISATARAQTTPRAAFAGLVIIVSMSAFLLSKSPDVSTAEAVKITEGMPAVTEPVDVRSEVVTDTLVDDADLVNATHSIPRPISKKTDAVFKPLDPLSDALERTNKWVKTASNKMYCLQLLIAFNTKDQSVVEQLEELSAYLPSEQLRVYRGQLSGKQMVGVLYGEFSNRNDALQAIATLPAEVRLYNPIVRTAGGVRQELIPRLDG